VTVFARRVVGDELPQDLLGLDAVARGAVGRGLGEPEVGRLVAQHLRPRERVGRGRVLLLVQEQQPAQLDGQRLVAGGSGRVDQRLRFGDLARFVPVLAVPELPEQLAVGRRERRGQLGRVLERRAGEDVAVPRLGDARDPVQLGRPPRRRRVGAEVELLQRRQPQPAPPRRAEQVGHERGQLARRVRPRRQRVDQQPRRAGHVVAAGLDREQPADVVDVVVRLPDRPREQLFGLAAAALDGEHVDEREQHVAVGRVLAVELGELLDDGRVPPAAVGPMGLAEQGQRVGRRAELADDVGRALGRVVAPPGGSQRLHDPGLVVEAVRPPLGRQRVRLQRLVVRPMPLVQLPDLHEQRLGLADQERQLRELADVERAVLHPLEQPVIQVQRRSVVPLLPDGPGQQELDDRAGVGAAAVFARLHRQPQVPDPVVGPPAGQVQPGQRRLEREVVGVEGGGPEVRVDRAVPARGGPGQRLGQGVLEFEAVRVELDGPLEQADGDEPLVREQLVPRLGVKGHRVDRRAVPGRLRPGAVLAEHGRRGDLVERQQRGAVARGRAGRGRLGGPSGRRDGRPRRRRQRLARPLGGATGDRECERRGGGDEDGAVDWAHGPHWRAWVVLMSHILGAIDPAAAPRRGARRRRRRPCVEPRATGSPCSAGT
jgi:hypothetical protein